MFSLIKIPFKDSKEQTISPFLCDQVKVFGVCKGPCLERHALCKTLDKECLNIPGKCFVSIQLTKIVSASHFYGRILKYSTANDPTKSQSWVTVNDSFERINEELINVGSSPDTKIIHKNLCIGEMVMIETEHGNFFRAVILNILSRWFSVYVKVKLIDLGCIKELSSSKVYVLPSHLKEFRPVAVEIIISSMEPIEKIDSALNYWPVATTQIVRSLLEPIMLADLEFICKVELTLGITLWVNWLLAKKCIKCSHFSCKLYENNSLILPKELIQRNLVGESSQLIDKLIDLNKDAQVLKAEFLNIGVSKNESLVVKKSNKPLFSCEDQKVKIGEEIETQWAYLSNNIIYDVSVDYIEHTKCFLVRNMKFFDRILALQTDIDEAINNKTVTQLTCAAVGTVCLAIAPQENSYNRVLIQKIEDQKAEVFYVDYGGFCSVKIATLFTIPSNLITKLPFQVIECNLSGFEDIVEVDTINQFNNRFLQLTNTKMNLIILSSSKDAKLTGGSNYEVVLFNNDININITMSNEFNMYVNSAQIQNIANSNYKSSKYKKEYEDEFDEEDLMSQFDLLQSLIDSSYKANDKKIESNLNPESVVNRAIKLNEKKFVSNSENLINELIQDNSVPTVDKQIVSNSGNPSQQLIPNLNRKIKQKKVVKIVNKYCLVCNVTPVVPQCFWHQDETWIYLKLNILSVVDYEIVHTMDSVTINVKTNTVLYSFKSTFYAFVMQETFTCQVSFDGIYMKIQKLIQVKYQWPRLLKCPKKHKYIIYDVERMLDKTDSKILWIKFMNLFKMKAHKILSNTNYDSQNDSDDSDSNEYQIYED